MEIEYSEELKDKIINYTIEGIMRIYDYDKDTALKLIKDVNFEKSIKLAPDLMAHCSQEQLVDMII